MVRRTLAFGLLLCLPWPAQPVHALHAGAAGARGSRSYLGVDISDVSDDQVASLKLKEARGAQITRVDHDGPAGKAGLMVRDVVLKLNGQQIEGEEQFRRMLREIPAGRAITLLISRNGQVLDVSAQLADRAEVERRAWAEHYIVPEPVPQGTYMSEDEVPVPAPSSPSAGRSFIGSHLTFSQTYTGADLDTMGRQLAQFFGAHDGKGLLVNSVDSNSPAAQAGIHAGDVIVRVNGTIMSSKGAWARALHDCKGRPATVQLLRDHQPVTVTLSTDGKKRGSIPVVLPLLCASPQKSHEAGPVQA